MASVGEERDKRLGFRRNFQRMGRKPRIGLALGSGSARGWAHIGAIRALEERGVKPDLICGTSIGALVAAAYASGELDRLEKWVTGLGWTTVEAHGPHLARRADPRQSPVRSLP